MSLEHHPCPSPLSAGAGRGMVRALAGGLS
jgi:hypothetical protein